jgi:hypothetical protein
MQYRTLGRTGRCSTWTTCSPAQRFVSILKPELRPSAERAAA